MKHLSSARCWLWSWVTSCREQSWRRQQDQANIRDLKKRNRELQRELESSVCELEGESDRRGGLIHELRQEVADSRVEIRRLTEANEVLNGTIELQAKQEAARSSIIDKIIAENTAAATRATTTVHEIRDDI